MKIREVFAELVFKLGKKDKNLVVMVGDISHGILKNLEKNFQKDITTLEYVNHQWSI